MRKISLFLVLAVFSANLPACGSFAPPASCGEGIGGTADEALFGRYFSEMSLVLEATGEAPPPGIDSSAAAAPDDSLAIRMLILQDATVRACVQERTGGGGIPFDESMSVGPGEAILPLGEFDPGSYVVRMIVDGTLVKNLTFEVK